MSYDTLADQATIDALVANSKQLNIEVIVVKDKAAALEKIKELIPKGASVMNGASETLKQIGYIDYLMAGEHGWNNLHAAIVAEQDTEKRHVLRHQALLSDYYLGSVHALAKSGEMIIASNTGSQLPHIVYSSPHVIFVVGSQKVVPDLEQARKRLYEYVLPLEDARMMEAYKSHTRVSKEVLFHGESTFTGRIIRLILVEEKLGF